MGTTTCTNCGRHTAARSPTVPPLRLRRLRRPPQGRVEEYDIDRIMRRIKAVLYVIFLPVVGLLGQMVIGALVLLPFFFLAALSSGASGDGPVELMRGLTGFVFNWPGVLDHAAAPTSASTAASNSIRSPTASSAEPPNPGPLAPPRDGLQTRPPHSLYVPEALDLPG